MPPLCHNSQILNLSNLDETIEVEKHLRKVKYNQEHIMYNIKT